MALIQIEDKNIWDKFVDDSQYGQLFHKWDFLRIIERYSGYKLLPYGIFKGQELICIFPMFYKKYPGVKILFSPPPETSIPFMGPLMVASFNSFRQRKKENYLYIVADEINSELKKILPNHAAFSMAPNFFDVREFKWNGYVAEINYTYVIDLDRPLDDIWNSFDNDLRREIRNGAKQELVLKRMDEVNTLYDIVKNRYSEQGLNAILLDQRYLKDVLATFPDNVKLYGLYKAGNLVDMLVNYEYKGRLTYWIGAVNLDKKIHALEYLTWEFIKEGQPRGIRELEVQGANVERLCFFKSKFNPRLECFFYVNKSDFQGKVAEFAYKNILKKKWW